MSRSAAIRAVVIFVGATAVGLAGWYWFSDGRLSGLIYSAPDGERLTLDIEYPASRSVPPPVVLFAPHEPNWKPELRWEPRCRALLSTLTGHGYAVATLHFRVPGQYRFPSQLEDGQAAVRWLRANARRYGLNADRIGAIGVSAGGYGICLLGTAGPGDVVGPPSENAEYSSRVQAVVAMGAPADLCYKPVPEKMYTLYLKPYLGASIKENPELYERASPGTYASPDDPPFLLFHSHNDFTVPIGEIRSFANALRKANVPVELVEDDGYDHIWRGAKFQEAVDRTVEFFDQHLKAAPSPTVVADSSRRPK
jgi:acetyl esterase/lipase